jgi:hypothetical protein
MGILAWLFRRNRSNTDYREWLPAPDAAAYATAVARRTPSVRGLLDPPQKSRRTGFYDDWGNFHATRQEWHSHLVNLSVRTLLTFARNGKIDFKLGAYLGRRRNGGRKLWFSKSSLHRLVAAHWVVEPRSRFVCTSETLGSRKVASSRYAPGEVITKAEAARILDCSIRGVEHLVDMEQLKAIRLGHRLVVFQYKKVRALQRVRTPRSGKRKARYRGQLIDSLIRTKSNRW